MVNQKKKNPIGEVLSYAKDKKQIIGSVILALFGVIGGLVPFIMAAKIAVELINHTLTSDKAIQYGIIALTGYTVKTISYTLATSCSHRMAYGIMAQIREMLSDKLLRLSMGKVSERSIGAYKQILMDQVEHMEYPLAHMVPELTSNIIGFLLILIYMLTVSWQMTLAALWALILGFLIYGSMMAGKDVMGMFRKYTKDSENMAGTMVEYVNGMEVIKAFGRTASSLKKYESSVLTFKDSMNVWFAHCHPYLAGFNVATPNSLLFILPIGGILLMLDIIPLSAFIICMFLSLGIAEPIIKIMDFADHIMAIITAMGKVNEIMEIEELVDGSKEFSSINTICAEQVSFGYNDKEVLHDVSFEIHRGEKVAFVGPSGSGKSTIAKLLVRFYDVDGGAIKIGGIDIKESSLDQLMYKVSFVTQDNFLFNQSVLENIRFGNSSASEEMVINAAKRAGCHEFIMELPKQYNTSAGEAGDKLSGGQRQRIAIARVILKDAPIIILDEATAFMDPENEDKVQRSIEELTKDKTLIMIAHRLATVVNSDKIFVVNHGCIEASGTHQELLEISETYSKLWNLNQQSGNEVMS